MRSFSRNRPLTGHRSRFRSGSVRSDVSSRQGIGRGRIGLRGKRDFKNDGGAPLGPRDFTVPRNSVRARASTRSPNRDFDHGRSFGKDFGRHAGKSFGHGGRRFDRGHKFGRFDRRDKSRHFDKGRRFGHFDKHAFGTFFFFAPYPYYSYYSPFYDRYYYPGPPLYGPPYYDNRYYYDRPSDLPYDQQYSEPNTETQPPEDTPYAPPQTDTDEQTDDAARQEYERFEQERAAEQARVADYLHRIAEPFRRGDYAEALNQAEQATAAEPDNPILGFAYTQALFANGRYDEAAEALRKSLNAVDMQKQGLFFGEILYPDPGVLNARIADLQQTAQVRPGSADLYLLLSYELMAAGRYDEVPQALRNAQSYANLQAIDLLKEVLDEIRRARPPTEY